MSTVWGSNGGYQRRPFTGRSCKITIKMAHMGEDVDATLYLWWFLVDVIYELRLSLSALRTDIPRPATVLE